MDGSLLTADFFGAWCEMGTRVLDDLPGMMNNSDFKAAYDSFEQEFSIARALIQARADAGLTQAEVAGKMGVTQSTIARMESGRNVSIKSLTRYAHAVGKPIRLEILPL